MGISDMIASFIQDTIQDSDGMAELQRAELANKFNCVPSQINYVISTRFSPEHGYIVESRRGGGGYIRIRRVRMDAKKLIMHTVNAVGESVTQRCAEALISNAVAGDALDIDMANIMLAAVGDAALKPLEAEQRDAVRANVLKQMLINTL